MKPFVLSNKRESEFCRLSLDNGKSWIQGIITDFSDDDEFICLFLSLKNFYKYSNCKNKIIVKSLNNNFEKIYIGSIDKNSFINKPRFLKINIENVFSFYDRRKYTRFLINYNATIQYNNCKFKVKLFDISFNGLSFFSKHNIKHASTLQITINISPKQKLKLTGNIVSQITYENEFRYSIKTTPQTQEDEDTLIQTIDSLLLKQNGILKNYNLPIKIVLTLTFILLTIIFGYILLS